MKFPEIRSGLNDINITDFNGNPRQEAVRAVVSLFLGLLADYGAVAASAALISTFGADYPELASLTRDASTGVIAVVSLLSLASAYFHTTMATQ